MKKAISFISAIILIFSFSLSIFAENEAKNEAEYWDIYQPSVETDLNLPVKSAVLMELETGKILYSQNPNEALAPASVTKTMSLLLVAEALKDGKISLSDEVSISSYAASMGGSQVFLKEGEIMSVEELLKCTVIASANDAVTALAEHTMGSESAFVEAMNKRAAELGLTASIFENVTGLDDDVKEHKMSAGDIAVISRLLLKHDIIRKYSSVWQDSIRDGQFVLTNTNRLVRYYEGCTGLKTGSTEKAGFCVSASAKRGPTELIAVVMGAESGNARNEAARTLLDFGFANYSLYEKPEHSIGELKALGSSEKSIPVKAEGFSAVINKQDLGSVSVIYELPESVHAPLKKGAVVGRAVFKIGDEIVGASNIYVTTELSEASFWKIFIQIFSGSFTK